MCQLFISKDFETSLLTLLGVSLVLWRRKADNEHSNPPVLWPLAPKFSTSAFPIPNYFTFKNFVRSHRDWEKKCREGSRHSPSTNRYGFANSCILSVPFCIVVPTHEKEGGGEILAGREGESTAWNDDDVGLEMKWLAFHILYTMAFLRARGEHILLFVLLLLLELCFAPCILYFGSWNKLKKSLIRLGKDENLGASWTCLLRNEK